MNNFWTRFLTGSAFVVLMVGGILWNIWSFIGLFSLIALLGLWEFYSILEQKEERISKIAGFILGIVLIAASAGKYFFSTPDVIIHRIMHFIIILFPVFLIIQLFKSQNLFQYISPTLFGILYIILPFCYLIISYSSMSYLSSQNNSKIILGYFMLLWSNDTFAYLVGRSIGKTKLFERISPKKTWEGTLGGLICTLGVAYILSFYITDLALIHWLVIALIATIFGTLGDLVESMFKRRMEIKDSGNILPGHGGILDRFDGVLLSSPFVSIYLMIIL